MIWIIAWILIRILISEITDPAMPTQSTDNTLCTYFPRGCIGDERVPSMAAEALALVLITHGTCRMAWTRQGNFLALLALMRCVNKRVTAKTDWV